MRPEQPPVTGEPVAPQATELSQERGPAPVGTLVVIGVLLLSIIWLWMLVLGILQGRA